MHRNNVKKQKFSQNNFFLSLTIKEIKLNCKPDSRMVIQRYLWISSPDFHRVKSGAKWVDGPKWIGAFFVKGKVKPFSGKWTHFLKSEPCKSGAVFGKSKPLSGKVAPLFYHFLLSPPLGINLNRRSWSKHSTNFC